MNEELNWSENCAIQDFLQEKKNIKINLRKDITWCPDCGDIKFALQQNESIYCSKCGTLIYIDATKKISEKRRDELKIKHMIYRS